MLDWIGLRRQSDGHLLSLRRITVASSGCCALRYVSHEPTYERAPSECDYACFGAQRTPPSGPARFVTIGAAATLPGDSREVGRWARMQQRSAKRL
jgi:hypothetical protein